MDFSTLSNDDLAAGLRDYLQEAERRLEAQGFAHYLKRMQAAHAVLQSIGTGLSAASQISPASVGGNK